MCSFLCIRQIFCIIKYINTYKSSIDDNIKIFHSNELLNDDISLVGAIDWKKFPVIKKAEQPLPGQFNKVTPHNITSDDITVVCQEVLKQVAELSHKTKHPQVFLQQVLWQKEAAGCKISQFESKAKLHHRTNQKI